jgi:predicted permease
MALFSSIRFSIRILRKHAKLSCIAVFSLAIGMAAASVGLSTYNAMLVRPPAVPNSNRLLTIYTVSPQNPFNQVSYPDYQFYRDNNGVFSGLCAMPFSISMQTIIFEHRQRNGLINSVSDNYFSVLGVQPFLGNFFTRGDDDKPTTSAVLSYPYWKWLGSDPTIVGKSVMMNGFPLTIVGVAPPNFAGTILADLPDLWKPLSADSVILHQGETWRADRTNTHYSMIGRLKPGVTRQQALADVQGLSRQLSAAFPQFDKDHLAAVTQTSMLAPDWVPDARVLGLLILAVVGLVLFAACANVANLLLALASSRRHEILIRSALGATRARLIRQLLLDSTIISAAGGALGFALAYYGLHRLMDFKPYIPGIGMFNLTLDFRPDFTVLAAMIGVVMAVGVVTGLAPSLHSSTPNLAGALSGEIAVGGTRKGRIRSLLVIVQVAACTIVLVGVGLCVRSMQNLRNVNLGFSARDVAILMINDVHASGYSEQQGRALYTRMRESISQLPGIESVSLSGVFPLDDTPLTQDVQIDGASTNSEHGDSVNFGIVDANYFSTLGIPLLAGRVFTNSDTSTAPEPMVINRTMAEKYWPNQNPIGRTARSGDGKDHYTVIGVVGDTKYAEIDDPPEPFIYFPLYPNYLQNFSLLARTHGNAQQSIGMIQEGMRKLDPNINFLPLTMDEVRSFALFIPRMALITIGGFGALAFILAAVGLYGAVFYSVSERTREMGIRIALGAEPWDLWKLVLRQTSAITAIGIVLGIAGGVGASILARDFLYQIQPVEWVVFFGVALTMIAMTLATAYSAARPWMRVDPIQAVRHV